MSPLNVLTNHEQYTEINLVSRVYLCLSFSYTGSLTHTLALTHTRQQNISNDVTRYSFLTIQNSDISIQICFRSSRASLGDGIY